VDAEGVLALEREEMVDLLVTSHWDQKERGTSHLTRLPAGEYSHLFARSGRGEGFFLIWNGPTQKSVLTRTAVREVAAEAQRVGLRPPYHIYARLSTYGGPNIEFYQIPDRILEKLGFNEALDEYSPQRSDDE
jgi:adenine-specific DNA-methyltransferase